MIDHFSAIFHLALEGNFWCHHQGEVKLITVARGGGCSVIDSLLQSVKSWMEHINPQLSGTLHSAQT